MKSRPPTFKQASAVILATTTALFARSWLQVELRAGGMDKLHATDLSYLVVPPILLLLLFPVLRANKVELRRQFDVASISAGLVLNAIGLGVLVRLAWWCQLVAGISAGIYSNAADPRAAVGPAFDFQCPPGTIFVTGIVVMAILVPIVEEVVHRGFIQSALYRYGPAVAIAGSAAIFTVFHQLGSWSFVFFAGVVLGTQYWITKSLWSSLITHATINGLIQVDWRCLRGQWNPPATELPIVAPGTLSLVLFLACVATTLAILRAMHRGEVSPR